MERTGRTIFAVVRAMRRELFEFLKSGRALMFAFLAPPLIVVLIGQLSVRPQNVHVAVTGIDPDSGGDLGRRLVEVLQQMPGVTAVGQATRPSDPLGFLADSGNDLAVVIGDLGTKDWGVYTAETEPSRMAGVRRLALLIEQTRSKLEDVHVHVAVTGIDSDSGGDPGRRLVEVLQQMPGVTAVGQATRPSDPLGFLADSGNDVAVVIGDLGTEHWGVYTAETEPSRLTGVLRLALWIEQTRPEFEESQKEHAQAQKQNIQPRKEAAALQDVSSDDLRVIGILPPKLLYAYAPDAAERSAGFLPMSIALLICFFPFVMGSPALVQEVEVNTAGATLCAPGLTHNLWFAAKFLFPVLIASVDALIMFACAEAFYQLHIKPGAVILALCVLLAAAAGAFLGLAISSVVKSSSQAGASSAMYFLCLLMLSGFFIPLDQSGAVVRAAAAILPLAPLDHAIKTWLFGGNLVELKPLIWQLGEQVFLDGTLALVCYRFIFIPRL